MNFNSLLTKITFIFVVSIALFIAVFIGYYYYQENQLYKQVTNNFAKISKHFKEYQLLPNEIVTYMQKLNFEILDEPLKIDIEKYVKGSGPGFAVIYYNKSFYMDIHTPDFRIIAKDLDNHSLNYLGFFILASAFIIYVLIFLWIIKSLKPLKNLKIQIQEFSKGNLSIDCKSDKKDEIADVANEFHNAVEKISLLLNSRQLFLRTVMHELKTPIAKGRIISELLEDEKQKNRMITIFDKLNLQLNDFSKIEQIVSKHYSINKYSMHLHDIVEKSIDMMMLDNPQKKIKFLTSSKVVIKVDLELFSLAIKNLLDNGIKYSDDKKVEIVEEENCIKIISKGEKLQKSLDEYFKAYHNETKSKNHGMGLGLYIVNEIVKMHDMILDYEYLENKNIFKIKL